MIETKAIGHTDTLAGTLPALAAAAALALAIMLQTAVAGNAASTASQGFDTGNAQNADSAVSRDFEKKKKKKRTRQGTETRGSFTGN